MDFSLGYQVILLPVLWALLGFTVTGLLIKGITRTKVERDGFTVGQWGYRPNALKRAAIVLGIGLFVLPAIVVTPPGHRAVIYNAIGGVQEGERGEGVSLIVPYFSTAKQVNVREHLYFTDEAFAQSADLQEITVHVAVGHFIRPPSSSDIVQDVGMDYERILIKPAVNQLVKQEVGLVLAEDFAQQRAQLAAAILAQLQSELDRNGIQVTYVAIEDAIFDPQFIASVKDKVIADQNADEARRRVAEETARKDQREQQALAAAIVLIEEARGEAEAIRQISDTLGFTAEEYLRYQLQLRWDGVLPETFLGAGGDLGLIFDGTE